MNLHTDGPHDPDTLEEWTELTCAENGDCFVIHDPQGESVPIHGVNCPQHCDNGG
jgi:hypothetical protein